jgi:hypothetical protein
MVHLLICFRNEVNQKAYIALKQQRKFNYSSNKQNKLLEASEVSLENKTIKLKRKEALTVQAKIASAKH